MTPYFIKIYHGIQILQLLRIKYSYCFHHHFFQCFHQPSLIHHINKHKASVFQKFLIHQLLCSINKVLFTLFSKYSIISAKAVFFQKPFILPAVYGVYLFLTYLISQVTLDTVFLYCKLCLSLPNLE